MSGKIVSRIASRCSGVCLLAIVLLAGSLRAAVAEEPPYEPFIPNPNTVFLTHENGTRYINVTIDMPAWPMTIDTWGTVEVSNGEAWANAKIWDTGWLDYIYPESHVYILAKLQPGDYTFTFKVWDTPIKAITFTYTCRPIDLNGDGIVDLYDLVTVCKAYGRHLGEPGYNPDADLNMDDLVDIRDVTLVCRCWGDP